MTRALSFHEIGKLLNFCIPIDGPLAQLVLDRAAIVYRDRLSLFLVRSCAKYC